ncbi:hypothetical protein BDV10DRAFT_114388 [Aspergillus recurvatus]
MSHLTPYPDQESQSQAQPWSQPFLLAFFPWICLFISLLFVLVYYRKSLASGCRPLRQGTWSRVGLNRWIWGYRPVDGDADGDGNGNDTGDTEGEDTDVNADEAGNKGTDGDRSTSVTAPIPELSNKHELNPLGTGTPSTAKPGSELSCNDDNSDNSTDKEEGGVSLSLSIAKYFDPSTGLLHDHVLDPPSPSPYSPQSMPEDYHDHAVYTDSEEDVDLDDNVEGAVTSNNKNNSSSSINNGDHRKNAYSNAEADAGSGWVHRLVQMVVRGLESLHDTYGNGNEDNNSGPGKPGRGLRQS